MSANQQHFTRQSGSSTLAALFLLLLAVNFQVVAQVTTATILGTITDDAGAAVVGAEITVKNVGTGITHTTTSDSQGRYRVPDLGIGNYEVQVARQGFAKAVQTGLTLTVGSQNLVDVALKVGQTQDTITVEANFSQVEISSPTVGTLVSSAQMRDLPLNGRNFSQLMTLAPGVQTLAGSISTLFYGTAPKFSIAGSRPEGQAFMLDNTNVNNFWNYGTGSGALGSSLGVEAIAEFQTLTGNYGTQFGGNGAVVNAVTRSGTNGFHGSVYEFHRNSAFDARNFFDGPKVAPFKRNQFGASLGGPLKKDRAFFFVNYEGVRQNQVQDHPAFVLDANARKGILPGVANPVTIASAIQKILDILPVPQASDSIGGGIARVNVSGKQIADQNYFLGRVDLTLSSNDSLFGRYVNDRARLINPYSAGNTIALPLWRDENTTSNNYFTLEEKHVFSPTLLNQVRFGFVRAVETGKPLESYTPFQFFPGSGRPDGQIFFNSALSSLGPSTISLFNFSPNRFTYADDLIWTKGSHAINIGFAATRYRDNTFQPFLRGGQYTFGGIQQFLSGVSSLFLGARVGQDDAVRDARQWTFANYVNDQWKVSPKLTLTLGLRYEPTTQITERRNKFQALINAPFGTGFTPVKTTLATNPSKKNFAPRVGFAWDVFGDHKTSIRGGLGIFHSVILDRHVLSNYWNNAPYVTQVQIAGIVPTPYVGGFTPPPQPTSVIGVDYNTKDTPYMMQYYRVGPDPQLTPRVENDIFFNGDGMVSMFRFDNGHVDFKQRYIRTDKFVAERKARKALFGAYRNPFTDDESVKGMMRGTGNTTVIFHAGQLLALKEDSPPVAMNPHTLETKGNWDFHGKLTSKTFTAHPKLDPQTGELVCFGYAAKGEATADIAYYIVDKAGTIVHETWLQAPYTGMVHDFAVTQDYVVFPIVPITSDIERLKRGGPHFMWDPRKDVYLGMLPRRGAAKDLRWFRGACRYSTHLFNGFNDGAKIYIDTPVAKGNVFPFFPDITGAPFDLPKSAPHISRWTIDLNSSSEAFEETTFDTNITEFPRIDDRYHTQPHRHGYVSLNDLQKPWTTNWGPPQPFMYFNTMAHFDFAEQKLAKWYIGPGSDLEEVQFIPRSQNAPEGDGYLIALVNRHYEARTELVVLDATRVAAGPVATIYLPFRLRSGLHGTWVPSWHLPVLPIHD